MFPNIQVRLCYFHVLKAMKEKRGKLGLIPLMKHNKSLRTWLKHINQIFWFPIALIPRVWDCMFARLDEDMQSHPQVLAMKAYMESTYIHTSFPIMPGLPKFSPFMTNLFEYEDEVTTNNNSESNNFRVNTRFGRRPNINKFCSSK